MKKSEWTLPVLKYRNHPITIGAIGNKLFMNFQQGRFSFYVDKWPVYILSILVLLLIIFTVSPAINITFVYQGTQAAETPVPQFDEGQFEFPIYPEDTLPIIEASQVVFKESHNESIRKRFIREREKILFVYKSKHMVGRLEQLDGKTLLELNRHVSKAFVDIVLKNMPIEKHVMHFLTDTTDLNKLETALMEQVKFHVPASIKLAQAAVETSYGRRVIHNNYFGIKDKARKSDPTTTTEYYTAAEMRANKAKIISKQKVTKNGITFYKCLVRDHFSAFETPWKSFRGHSIFLSSNNRYAPLFTKGKSYQDWADKIGSTKYGGVGYATSPIYGKILKGVIKRYNLDLLDF